MTSETATLRTYVAPKMPKTIGIVRVVTPEKTVAIVSERLDAEEQSAARIIAAYLGQPDDNGCVSPVVVIREDQIIAAVSEATESTRPEPVQP